ncbi:MAG: hypothetical protein PHO91_03050 [Patescibacteria group bacterium]|nr:hypothetical protein [Patescibacteria group bacterium]
MGLALAIKKNKPKAYFWLIVPAIIVFALPFSLFLYPKKEALPLSYYLPEGVSFYLELDTDFWAQDIQGAYHWFDLQSLDNLHQEQFEQWGPYFSRLEKIILFKTGDSQRADNFLLYFSRLPDKSYLKKWQAEHSGYRWQSVGRHILLVVPQDSEDFAFGQKYFYQPNSSEQPFFSFYGSILAWPEFLLPLADILSAWQSDDAIMVFVSPDGRQIDFGRTARSVATRDFSGLRAIADTDFALAFSDLLDTKDFFAELLKQTVGSLPYHSLAGQGLADIVSAPKALLAKDNGWLLAGESEAVIDILRFLNVLVVKEVAKILPDGTPYYELVADKEQSFAEHELKGRVYRQFGDIYSLELGDFYYLTNQEDFAKELIINPRYLENLLACGKTQNLLISDFFWLKTAKIDDGNSLKNLFLSQNIDYFRAFAYYQSDFSGVRVCF